MTFPITFHRPQMGLVDQPEEGEVKSSQPDGGPSTQSSESVPTSSDKPSRSRRSPAPTTDNHSKPTMTEISDVISTDGGGQETQRPQSARARTRVIPDEDDFAEFL